MEKSKDYNLGYAQGYKDAELLHKKAYESTYNLITWPEIQDFMNHPDYSEKVFLGTHIGHPAEYVASTWFVPVEMCDEIYNDKLKTLTDN